MRARLGAAFHAPPGAAFHAPPELPRNVCPVPPPLLAAWAQGSSKCPIARRPASSPPVGGRVSPGLVAEVVDPREVQCATQARP